MERHHRGLAARVGASSRTALLVVALTAVAQWTPQALAAFPDAFNTGPPGWTGPKFKLSQSYPATKPALEPASKRRWKDIDFKTATGAPQYLRAVLNYCLEGNLTNNFADVSSNTVRKWYHAPWLHTTGSGREFIHGLTKERPSRPTELGPAQTNQHDNWAVGFYNARGGYTIGQVWKDPLHPDPRKGVFPSHTVACKLIFTTAPLTEVPFLDGSLKWQADVSHSNNPGANRPDLLLLQLDVAVRDPRANSTTGWVFGTFQYEKAAANSANWWEHLVPVGLMWGNDVTHVIANQASQQQWINTLRGQQLHLGFRGLLNGPIDNPQASCTGCHWRAQVNRVNNPAPSLPGPPPGGPAATPTPSTAALQRYFTNRKAAEALSADYVSVDYSLQLQLGIRRALDEAGSGVSLPADFGTATTVVHAAHPVVRPPATTIVPVERDQ